VYSESGKRLFKLTDVFGVGFRLVNAVEMAGELGLIKRILDGAEK
jgi:hypothetical protein